jgi:hypothetical protein
MLRPVLTLFIVSCLPEYEETNQHIGPGERAALSTRKSHAA